MGTLTLDAGTIAQAAATLAARRSADGIATVVRYDRSIVRDAMTTRQAPPSNVDVARCVNRITADRNAAARRNGTATTTAFAVASELEVELDFHRSREGKWVITRNAKANAAAPRALEALAY
jgi:hypothetical protein